MAMDRKARAATESGVLLLIIAGVLVALNALGALGQYKRFDTTKAERFTLSKGSGKLLAGMKGSMHVDAYVTKGLPKLDAFTRDLRDLLQEYKDNSGGKFDYTMIEAKDDTQKDAAKKAGLVEQPFGEASATEEKAAVTQGFMGLVFKYGAEQDVIKFLPPDRTDGLEFWITNKVREIVDRADDVKHKIGVLTGDDEMKLSEANLVPTSMGKPSMQEIITRNFPFYTLSDVDLKGGDSEIPDDLDGLIITQPNKDLSEKELRRIDQFVMKGKSVAIFAGAVNMKAGDATMSATMSLHGLDKLLAGYGIEVKKDVILDFGRSFTAIMPTQGSIAARQFPTLLDVQDDSRFTGDEQLLDTSFPGFFRIPEIVVPFASSLALHPEKQPDASPKILGRSTPRSIVQTGDTLDLSPLQRWKPKGEWAQYAFSAALDGTIKSAFTKGGDFDVPEKSVKPSRIFFVSSSQFLANPFARQGNGPDMGQFGQQFGGMGGDQQLLQLAGPYAQQALTGTILAFKNTLDWLTGDTDLLAVSAKILSEPGLVYGDVSKPKFDPNATDDDLKKEEDQIKAERKNQQSRIEWFLILGLPALFSGFGLVRWRYRIASRKNVSLA